MGQKWRSRWGERIGGRGGRVDGGGMPADSGLGDAELAGELLLDDRSIGQSARSPPATPFSGAATGTV